MQSPTDMQYSYSSFSLTHIYPKSYTDLVLLRLSLSHTHIHTHYDPFTSHQIASRQNK